MRKMIFLTAFIFVTCVRPTHAVEPVSVIPWLPESRYDITNSTIAFSSTTVTTIAAVDGYRKIKIRDLTSTTSFFYRLDGSTQTITTTGFFAGPTEVTEIETNQSISILLVSGVANKVFQILTFRK